MTLAERILNELERRDGQSDAQLARALDVRHQAVNGEARKLEDAGDIQRVEGSAADGSIGNWLARDRSERPLPTQRTAGSSSGAHSEAEQGDPSEGLPEGPGTQVDAADLLELGFRPLDLDLLSAVELSGGTGREWDTCGDVPGSPGLYAFTIEQGDALFVTYVGLTEHLWMVTKGRLPGGHARGGQRYGRPKHAGETRQRINILVAKQLDRGRVVRHWVRPMASKDALRPEESALITRWRLVERGWNRSR